ncbi:hypothetical protein [Sodalinema gerasimenkoae]|uniref:hypothetical protein n=1 Tax=Sodalinema gerasimenkoae TaxID=2862348 RepID=UPI0031B5DE0E
MPWVTYTDPEVAHVGLYEGEAQEKGIETKTIKIEFKDLDRAIADGETEGFLKVLHEKSSDKILGATIVMGKRRDFSRFSMRKVQTKSSGPQLSPVMRENRLVKSPRRW